MAFPRIFSAHALNRCLDRYGFIPTPEQEAMIFLDLVEGRCVMVAPLNSANCGRWVVWFRDTKMLLAYNPEQARVVTVLPPERIP